MGAGGALKLICKLFNTSLLKPDLTRRTRAVFSSLANVAANSCFETLAVGVSLSNRYPLSGAWRACAGNCSAAAKRRPKDAEAISIRPDRHAISFLQLFEFLG